MTNRLSNKRIAITGAGSGLGRCIALRFAREGWRVAVTDVNGDAAQAVLQEVLAAGGNGFTQLLDVSAEQDFATLAASLKQTWGGVDVFVNNAGLASGGSVLEAAYEQWQKQLDVNLLGVLRGCRAAVPLMQAGGEGHIVNIASFAGIACPPGMASYNTAKAGVIALSESLRGEVYDEGIEVSVACPAFFPTNLLHRFDGTHPAQKVMAQKFMENSGVTAEDVAEGIFNAVMDKQFMVIAHEDSRRQYQAKRADPEAFFHEVRKSMARFAKPG